MVTWSILGLGEKVDFWQDATHGPHVHLHRRSAVGVRVWSSIVIGLLCGTRHRLLGSVFQVHVAAVGKRVSSLRSDRRLMAALPTINDVMES